MTVLTFMGNNNCCLICESVFSEKAHDDATKSVSFCILADLVFINNWASLCVLWNCNGFGNTFRKATT